MTKTVSYVTILQITKIYYTLFWHGVKPLYPIKVFMFLPSSNTPTGAPVFLVSSTVPQRIEVHGDPLMLHHILNGGEHTFDILDNSIERRRVLPAALHRGPCRLWSRQVKLVGVTGRSASQSLPPHSTSPSPRGQRRDCCPGACTPGCHPAVYLRTWCPHWCVRAP